MQDLWRFSSHLWTLTFERSTIMDYLFDGYPSSTHHHSSVSTRLHTLYLEHNVHEFALISVYINDDTLMPAKPHPVSPLLAYRRRVTFAARARFGSQQEGLQRALFLSKANPFFCPNLRLDEPFQVQLFLASLWRRALTRQVSITISGFGPWGRIGSGSLRLNFLEKFYHAILNDELRFSLFRSWTLLRSGKLPSYQPQYTARPLFFDGVFTYMIGRL
ncbi:hypothetical protein ARMSODRAFT_371821 [Armillaria solidipes]|uniref:Uncharacterized protein n=1 Tax=Armillaria solidipes TaxID=1076256 RepID=A0A2H3B919_9AGAR|nr:hypothetical protein ARMSODRAFT_371821 [Armillaria solidipes]